MNKPFERPILPGDPETAIYPGLDCHVSSEEEFRAKVEQGLADIRAGRIVSLDEAFAEMDRIIEAEG